MLRVDRLRIEARSGRDRVADRVVGGQLDVDLLRDASEHVRERRHREHGADRRAADDDRADRQQRRPASVDDDLAETSAACAARFAQRLRSSACRPSRDATGAGAPFERTAKSTRPSGSTMSIIGTVGVGLQRGDEPVQRRAVVLDDRLADALGERDRAHRGELLGLDPDERRVGAGAGLHEPRVERRARARGGALPREVHGEDGDGDADQEMELPPHVPVPRRLGPRRAGLPSGEVLGPGEPGILGDGHRRRLEARSSATGYRCWQWCTASTRPSWR